MFTIPLPYPPRNPAAALVLHFARVWARRITGSKATGKRTKGAADRQRFLNAKCRY
jgi:hypothetical protein